MSHKDVTNQKAEFLAMIEAAKSKMHQVRALFMDMNIHCLAVSDSVSNHDCCLLYSTKWEPTSRWSPPKPVKGRSSRWWTQQEMWVSLFGAERQGTEYIWYACEDWHTVSIYDIWNKHLKDCCHDEEVCVILFYMCITSDTILPTRGANVIL